MNRHKSELSDEQWEKIAPFLSEPQASPWGGPKPSSIMNLSLRQTRRQTRSLRILARQSRFSHGAMN